MNKHNLNVLRERIKTDLETLSSGITLTINSCDYNIAVWCHCFVGDALAANEFGGLQNRCWFCISKVQNL